MELFRIPNFEFLGKKRYLLRFSAVALVASTFSILFWHGIPLSVDFKGGKLVYLKFADRHTNEAALDAGKQIHPDRTVQECKGCEL